MPAPVRFVPRRLKVILTVEPGSALEELLTTARPDACLAVRLGKAHERGDGEDPLLICDICGRADGSSTCVPALVGGEGIGSVRTAIAARAGVPTLFVRRGLRPSGVAPNQTLTRFTWTLASQDGQPTV